MSSFAPNQLWRTMPGWGITTNLLPPEIVIARRIQVLRKMVVSSVLLVLLVGAGGYFYALSQKDDASSELGAAQTQTAVLRAQQAKFSEVVMITADTQAVTSQLTTVLQPDVDMKALLSKVIGASPPGGKVTSLQVQITGVSAVASATTSGAGALDNSGRVHVGTASITGDARNLSDVAAYVAKLNRLPGIVTAFPSSQTSDSRTVTYTIQMTLTDQVFSHRYDSLASGVAAPQGGS